jgi:transcriptional regulator with XRE-family HTH domain
VKKRGSQHLLEELKKRGWTMRQAGAELGCSAGTVCRWAHGLAFPKPAHIRKMKERLGVPPEAWF